MSNLKEIERFKGWFKKFCGCCICACCDRLPCFRKNNTVTPENDSDQILIAEHMETISRYSVESSAIMDKDKKKELIEARRRKKLFQQKENMKKVQEKNTVKAPTGILQKCFPAFAYK